MKKIIKLENLDCANCAAKIESKISKIDGVQQASVNFVTQKIILELDETKEIQIIEQMKKIISKVEPDTRILL